jgi:hypothetical protein
MHFPSQRSASHLWVPRTASAGTLVTPHSPSRTSLRGYKVSAPLALMKSRSGQTSAFEMVAADQESLFLCEGSERCY